MVNKTQISLGDDHDRLSMRHSLVVWIAGAVLGWVVAVVSVWMVMDNAGTNIAKKSPSNAEQMEQIMPAADKNKEK